MKIAVISMIREPWGGSEELWYDMAIEAMKQGHTVIHSSYSFEKLVPKQEKLVREGLIHISRRGFIKSSTPAPTRIFLKLLNRFANIFTNPFKELFKHKPDYILYNGTCYSIADERMLQKILNKEKTPFGIIAHYNREDGKDADAKKVMLTGQIFNKAKNIFFVSRRTLQTAQLRVGGNIPNALLVRNPVNLSSTEILPYPAPGSVNFAIVGNLRIVHKGQDIILDIFCEDKWKQRDWHLNLFGSGEDEEMLKRLIKTMGLEERVTFHGNVANLRQVWARNHILLMPSRMEGMPLAMVEAMICGRPSVVTDVGGHTEWIEEGKEGWIAAQADKTSFADAMEKAWEQKDNWEKVGVQAHHKALTLYDPQPGKTLLTHIINSLQR